MGYVVNEGHHTYVFEVDYGEEMLAARITVFCTEAAGEGLFLVKSSGRVECADDLPGFSTNPLRVDGLWPYPPADAISDARRIAQAKAQS
jgi:hypothetical protein